MKVKSQLVTQVSGSIGGLTGSHNKGGMYFRARSIPTNPSSSQQQAVRNAVAALATRWVETLTAAQRDAWTTYAANVPLIDSLGEPRTVPPLAMYVRSNTPRVQAGIAIVDDGPTIYDLATLTPPVVVLNPATSDFDLGFTNTDPWAIAAGGYLFAYASRAQNPTIVFFKGPYRFAGKVTGAATPPTSPETINLPFPVSVGQQIFMQFRASNADGRLSAPFRLGETAS